MLMFQAIEEPFLFAVKQMIGERYTTTLETLYTKTIKFILTLLVAGFNQMRRHNPA